MNAMTLKADLCRALREKSGLEAHRPYLGMSGIGGCPRKLYFDFVEQREVAGDQQHWYCWTGYLHEGAVVELLGSVVSNPNQEEEGVKPWRRQVEVVAGFDQRFRGHVDYIIGEFVVEVKSVGWEKFCRIKEDGQAQYEHRAQMAMYLRHGGWQRGYIVYIARDVPHREFEPPFWVFELEWDEGLMERMDRKARDVLAAIDRKEPPACTCSYCRR